VTHTLSTESKMSREVAEADLERFLAEMDLTERTDPSRLDADDQKKLRDVKENVVLAIMSGRLVISEDGCPVYTPSKGDQKPIKFSEPSGGDLMAMDKYKQTQTIAKQNALLGAISGEGPQRFANMKQRDLNVCSDLLMLFLA
jgi:hypothetical protein